MKKILKIFILLLVSASLVSCGEDEDNNRPQAETHSSESESTSKEPEKPKDYPEEEYKGLCEELYNDDFFKSEPKVGTLVKVHVMVSSKYKYSWSDTWGIVVRDITEKYNLEMNSIGCTVMHESTKDDAVPSYFGEQIYMMFIDGSEIKIDSFKAGQKMVIYGEVVQNKNGTFIIPKYLEEE